MRAVSVLRTGLTTKLAPQPRYKAAVGASTTDPTPRITEGSAVAAHLTSSAKVRKDSSLRFRNSTTRAPPAAHADTMRFATSTSPSSNKGTRPLSKIVCRTSRRLNRATRVLLSRLQQYGRYLRQQPLSIEPPGRLRSQLPAVQPQTGLQD